MLNCVMPCQSLIKLCVIPCEECDQHQPGWNHFSCPAQKQLTGRSHYWQIPPKWFENKHEKELAKLNGLDLFSWALEKLWGARPADQNWFPCCCRRAVAVSEGAELHVTLQSSWGDIPVSFQLSDSGFVCLGSLSTPGALCVPGTARALLQLQVFPKWELKGTKWRIPKAFPERQQNSVEISFIPTARAPHVSKGRIFKATLNLKGKVIRYWAVLQAEGKV